MLAGQKFKKTKSGKTPNATRAGPSWTSIMQWRTGPEGTAEMGTKRFLQYAAASILLARRSQLGRRRTAD